ncbi:MAG: hypothetical protein OHK0047_39540 [Leptolyngbyaceae cyanobacterium]
MVIPLAVQGNVFTAFVGQVRESFEAQHHNLFIEWVEFAQRGDVEDIPFKEFDMPLERALGGNQFAQSVGKVGIADFDRCQPLTNRS